MSNLLRSAVLLLGAPAVSEVTAAAGGAFPAFLSSSSLSDPPEELLSEATRGAFLPSPAGGAPGEALTSETETKRCVQERLGGFQPVC